ncbi:MAG: class I tRNA ligase family protein, partial [Gammaproteobacteria bacterium]
LMQTEDRECAGPGSPRSLADRWILSRLQQAIIETRRAIGSYRFDLAAQAIYDFSWHDYCDWYLEFSKPLLAAGDATALESRRTLLAVLESLARLAHPVMPFITEEIWQRVAPLAGCAGPSVMLAAYPEADAALIDPSAEADVAWLQQAIVAVRNIRGELNLGPGRKLRLLLREADDAVRQRVAEHQLLLLSLARLESVAFIETGDGVPAAATQIIGQTELLVPLEGLVDLGAERARLDKEQEKLAREIEKLAARLANPGFTGKAPAEVVEKERARLAELEGMRAALLAQRDAIGNPS